ncbi:MAG: tRNA dimethylallyltransferase, partial [Cyclobacteriaceae bacterium]
KDLDDYAVNGNMVAYHLIDIADPGEEYNVFRFQGDFLEAFNAISGRGKQAIMCGGTGMYLESVLLHYDLREVPENKKLRDELSVLDHEALIKRLSVHRQLHNVTDTRDRERMIRAIEIAENKEGQHKITNELSKISHLVFGIRLPREEIRNKITIRLKQRLNDGMAEEVENLLSKGLTPAQLDFYGLEYRYLTQFVSGEINYNDMFQRLNSAIHQFAKRQQTWFRRMEKKGVVINWIDGNLDKDQKLEIIQDHISSTSK